MIQQLRKAGNSFAVTVPKEVVERNGWKEGQLLDVELTELEVRPKMSPEVQAAFDATEEDAAPAMEYLASR